MIPPSAFGDRNQVAVLLSKSIFHLIEHDAQLRVAIIAKIYRKRIESITEDARKAVGEDAVLRGIEPGLAEMLVDPGPHCLAIASPMVAVMITEQVPGVV